MDLCYNDGHSWDTKPFSLEEILSCVNARHELLLNNVFSRLEKLESSVGFACPPDLITNFTHAMSVMHSTLQSLSDRLDVLDKAVDFRNDSFAEQLELVNEFKLAISELNKELLALKYLVMERS